MGFTNVFGGSVVYPSDVSYLPLAIDEDTTLQWPLEAATGSNLVARIIDVTPSTSGLSVIMPDATQTAPGQIVQFLNIGPDTITVKNSAGGTLLSIAAGLTWTLYLTDVSTAAGTWVSFQAGASTSQAQASALQGYGIVAIGSTLNQSQTVNTFAMDYTAGAADRSSTYVWTGGLGTLTMPSASAVGNNWFMAIRNAGTGNLTIATPGAEVINGDATITLRPGDSATINTNGTDFYTVGLGQDPVFAFDYTSIDLTGLSGTYTLAGSELNRIAYDFVGVLAGNIEIIVPATTQQYWVSNDTTGGSYTLSLGTATQVSPVSVNRGSRGIYYCQGSTVVNADTASISTPISIADGGTGATTASGARINLGGTSVGIAMFTAVSQNAGRVALGATTVGSNVFTAVDAAAARTAITAAVSGVNNDITQFTGLTTPLTVAQGGMGSATHTAHGVLIGNGASAVSTTGAGTAGQVLTSNGAAADPTFQAIPAGGTVTSVSGSGGTTGLTLTGGPITGTGTLTLGGTLGVANGGTGAATLTGVLKGNGTSAFTAATAGTDYVAPTVATNFTAKQTFTGAVGVIGIKLVSALERVTLSATAATGTINYDVTTQSVLYYTSSAAANWTVNFRGDGSNSLDSLMATGESITVAFRVTQGATAYYNSAVTIDGGAVTPKWQGGSAPTAGNVSGVDSYVYQIVKTGAATFTVFASVVQFA